VKGTREVSMDGEANALCHLCRKQCHLSADCWFKIAKCHMCLKVVKVEHLAKVCQSKQKSGAVRIPQNSKSTRSR